MGISVVISKSDLNRVIVYLHRALNKVTQSANQHMHTFNFFYLLKLI